MSDRRRKSFRNTDVSSGNTIVITPIHPTKVITIRRISVSNSAAAAGTPDILVGVTGAGGVVLEEGLNLGAISVVVSRAVEVFVSGSPGETITLTFTLASSSFTAGSAAVSVEESQ